MGNDLQLIESSQLAVQVDVANKYPRKLDTFVNNVFDIVVRDQDFAMSCIYCKPVGKTDGVQKFEIGPSVRLTEEMQKHWKHLRIAVDCIHENDTITCKGWIMDCQDNNAETLTQIASVKGWKSHMVELKIKAMQSMVKRDLRLSIMGRSYAKELIEKVLDTLFVDDEIKNIWQFTVDSFKSIGVKEEVVLKYFKATNAADLTKKEIFKAIGIYNYIKDNNEDPSEIFGDKASSTKPNVKPEDITEIKPQQGQKKPAFTKPQTKKPDPAPEVHGSDEFESLIASMIKDLGWTLQKFDDAIMAEYSIMGGIKNIPADMQNQIVDWLTSLQEQAGA